MLIPGSKSDKGWMESGYDGLKAAEKKHGDKIKVQLIENVKYADMEQALTTLATKNDLVIGVRRPDRRPRCCKVAKRFPKVKFSVVGGNKRRPRPPTSRSTTCKQAEIAYVAGAAAACCRRTARSATSAAWRSRPIVNAGKEFGNGAKYDQPEHQVLRELHRRLRRRGQVEGGDAGRHRAGRRHPLSHPQPRPARHGAGGQARRARTSSAATPTAAAPTRSTSAYSDHRRRLPGRSTRSIRRVAGTWKPGYKPFGLAMGPQGLRHGDLQRARPQMKAKLERDQEGPCCDGKIKVLEG